MLYYLFTYLREHFNLSGTGVFYYITFRASLAVILSLVIFKSLFGISSLLEIKFFQSFLSLSEILLFNYI